MSTDIALRAVDTNAIANLQRAGQSLFQSGLYPNAKNQHGAYAIVQYGYELGVGPMMALQNINIIQGRPAASGQLMLSLALSRGVTIHVEEESADRCVIFFKRGAMEYRSEFTMDDARTANLAGKDNWKKWPKEMLYWRAVAKGVRRIAPEAVMGLYTPDEVSSGDVVDVAPVDVKAEIVREESSALRPVDVEALRQHVQAITTQTALDALWANQEQRFKTDAQYKEICQIFSDQQDFITDAVDAEFERVKGQNLRNLQRDTQEAANG